MARLLQLGSDHCSLPVMVLLSKSTDVRAILLGTNTILCQEICRCKGTIAYLVMPAEDQASHLLWRLQHGEVFVQHPPQVSIVLIGTNDLGAAASCNVREPGATAAANGTAARYTCSL